MSEFSEEELKIASQLLSDKVKAAYTALEEAEQVAEKFGLSFSFCPERGMGGDYVSETKYRKDNDLSDDEDIEDSPWTCTSPVGWQPSSQGC